MIIKYTEDEYNNAKSEDLLKLECVHCHTIFERMKKLIKHELKYNKGKLKYCCSNCANMAQIKPVYNLQCTNCGKDITVINKEYLRSTSKNFFCCGSCAATYNNKVRGSRLESTKQKISKTLKEYNKLLPKKVKRKSSKHKHVNKHKEVSFTDRNNNIITLLVNIQSKPKVCKNCNREYYKNPHSTYNSESYCCEECKQEYYKKYIRPKLGGYRKGSGRSKSGWYKGIYCDSSWELAFVIYHLEHNLNITRCKEPRTYTYKDKVHTYIPDFITDKGIIEIKGYDCPQWQAKILQNPDIIVLYKDDMKLYLDYAIHKYGNSFIDLYDGSNPKKVINYNQYVVVHQYDDINRIYTTKYINPIELDLYLNDGWIKGRGKKIEGYTYINIKNRGGCPHKL